MSWNIRLQYLLKQSDIFAHFGGKKEAPSAAKAGSKSKRQEDWDEDDEALIKEVEEDDEAEEAPKKRLTQLTKQPSCITGGQLK